MVGADGTFEIRSITPGTHELRVVAFGGQLIHQEAVSINSSGRSSPSAFPIGRGSANRTTETAISLAQLEHKVPPAQKLYNKRASRRSRNTTWKACDFTARRSRWTPNISMHMFSWAPRIRA